MIKSKKRKMVYDKDTDSGIQALLKECSCFDELLDLRQLLMQLHDKQLITTKTLKSAFHLNEND